MKKIIFNAILLVCLVFGTVYLAVSEDAGLKIGKITVNSVSTPATLESRWLIRSGETVANKLWCSEAIVQVQTAAIRYTLGKDQTPTASSGIYAAALDMITLDNPCNIQTFKAIPYIEGATDSPVLNVIYMYNIQGCKAEY